MEYDIKVSVPKWAQDIKDEGLLIFIALLQKISYKYGYDEWYNFHLSDVNKVKGNLGNIRNLLEPYYPYIECATPFDNEVQFRLKHVYQKDRRAVVVKNPRHVRVWCYLIGCLNHNLIDKEFYGTRPPSSSAFTNEHEHHLFRSYDIQ